MRGNQPDNGVENKADKITPFKTLNNKKSIIDSFYHYHAAPA